MKKILIIDDDVNIANICAHFLKNEGLAVDIANTAADGMAKIRDDREIGLVFLDIRLPDSDGISALREIKAFRKGIEVIMISAHGTVENAAECMRLGAVDFLGKPFTRAGIQAAVLRATRFSEIEDEVTRLYTELGKKYRFENIVGSSVPMRELFEKMTRASENDSTILILGESGVGKDLIARAIHYNSDRREGPFIPVSCAALPSELIESELFGYKKGAFTGAMSDTVGLFRSAVGGTLFLDEIPEIPQATQAKLLRALQEKRVRPVGGTEEIEVDVRVICATNRNLEREIAAGAFRKDLFYRIGVITIEIPPLRERREDIPALVDHFIAKFNGEFERKVEKVDDEVLRTLVAYDWSGNVRELEHVIESLFALGKGNRISAGDLPSRIRKALDPSDEEGDVRDDGSLALADVEKMTVRKALRKAKGNKSSAARMLGITRKRLYNLIRRHRIRITS